MRGFRIRSTWLGVLALLLWSSGGQARGQMEFTTIPVVINLLKESNVNEEDARKIVEEASKILKQANVKLTVVKVNKDVVVPPDDNAELTLEELRKVSEAGGKEIEALDNKKGLKVTFAKKILDDIPGVAKHRDPTVVTVQRATDNVMQSGIILAHEIGHVLTLGSGHKIDDMTTADAGGHGAAMDNLMTPVEPPGGNTKLTADQIAEIRMRVDRHGKTVEMKTGDAPGEKKPQQYGAGTDDLDDLDAGVSPYFDLFRTMLTSDLGRDTIDTVLTLGGLFPISDVVAATYSLLFNADGDLNTGITLGGFVGADREVRIEVNRDNPGDPLSITGSVVDHLDGGTQTPLPSLPELFEVFWFDASLDPVETQFVLEIPKDLLGLSVLEVPVGVVARDALGMVLDEFEFLFELDRFAKDATFSLTQATAMPGQMVPFSVSGLQPDSPFHFFIDEDLLFSGILESDGSFTGGFIFPKLPIGETFFLTLQDSSGEFAFNKLTAIPEPSALLLLASGLGLVLLATRRRPLDRPREPSAPASLVSGSSPGNTNMPSKFRLVGLLAFLVPMTQPGESRADFMPVEAGLILNNTIQDTEFFLLTEFFGFQIGETLSSEIITESGWTADLLGTYLGVPVNVAYTGDLTTFPSTASWSSTGTYGTDTWTSSGSATFMDTGATTFELAYNLTLSVGGNTGSVDVTNSGISAPVVMYTGSAGTITVNGAAFAADPMFNTLLFPNGLPPMVGDPTFNDIHKDGKLIIISRNRVRAIERDGTGQITSLTDDMTLVTVPEPSPIALTAIAMACLASYGWYRPSGKGQG